MTVETSDWEQALLSLANAGSRDAPAPAPWHDANGKELALAYDYCEAVTALHSRSFSVASRFLPREKRRAMRALYAFCRRTDDIVDGPTSGPGETANLRTALADWQARSLSPSAEPFDPVVAAWSDTRYRYGIPQCYAEQLFQGVGRDVGFRQYETFADLATYCYEVAATVGLMCMHIVGFSSAGAIPYALKMGVALQLTNILRDVGEDLRARRLYLPLEELERFGLDESDVEAGRVDERWRSFMRFQIGRARRLYREAAPGIALLDPEGHFAIASAAGLYKAILSDIEAHDYDVFSRRAHVGALGKLRRLPAIWWRLKSMPRPQPGRAGP